MHSSELIPLIKSDLETLRNIQENGDYSEVEIFLSDIRATLNLTLETLMSEVCPQQKNTKKSEPHMTAREKLYAFLDLPHHVQFNRAKKLGLVEETDEVTAQNEGYLDWVKRAVAKGVVDELLLGTKSEGE